MKVLIIVLAYNEEENIQETVENILKNTSYDYIVINDGSTDRTEKICKKNNYNILSVPINHGITNSVRLGMKYALQNEYDIIIQFDGDGQHKAEYLPLLVKEIEQNNADIAIGSRFISQKKSISLRMFGNTLLSLLIKITTGKTIKDTTSGMRVYGKKAIEEFNKNPRLTPEPDTLVYMLKKGLKIQEVQVQMNNRKFGHSYLKPLKALKYMVDMIASIIFISVRTKKS